MLDAAGQLGTARLQWCAPPMHTVLVMDTNSRVPQVQGSYNISRLVAQTRPKVVIPLNNSEFPSSGPISKLIWSLESSDNLPDRLEDAAIRGVRVEQAKPPGQPLELRL